jgi:hypothetical protein
MLTPSAVANAKPQAKPYKLADERGMYAGEAGWCEVVAL